MQHQYNYSIIFTIAFTDEEFDFITKQIQKSLHHKYLAEVGGFWYGFMNRRNWAKTDEEYCNETMFINLTFRELDYHLLKALDGYQFYPKDSEERKTGEIIWYKLYDILAGGSKHVVQPTELITT